MNKQQLANKIWQSANKMRSKIEANDYKDYILGFVFYKFISDSQVRFLHKAEFTDNDIQELTEFAFTEQDIITLQSVGYKSTDIDSLLENGINQPDIEALKEKGLSDQDIQNLGQKNNEVIEFVQENIGYFISYENLFSTWLAQGNDFSIDNVRTALSAFNRNITQKKVFEGIFNTLDTGLSKLGDSTGKQTKAVRDLIDLIKDIPMDGKQDYDVLGFIYEYLISMFAANAGKKAGEFYTPHEVSFLMSEIIADHLKDRTEIAIYDSASGSGSLLINIGKSVAKHLGNADSILYYAQELKQNTYNLTRMNLVMRGIRTSNIITRNADTLEDDWPFFDDANPIETYKALRVDAVVSNPPYSQAWNSENKDSDPRYSSFGIAPKTKADFAFLLHDLYHVKPDGIMNIVLPHGVLFRGGEEEQIRKELIENDHIDAIIGLPANIFFGTGIPTVIIVLKRQRDNNDVLIIDASKGFVKEGKNNKLRACDIKKIVDTVASRKDSKKFAKLVSKQDIRDEGYNLNIPRYVDSSADAETYDIYATMFGGIPQTEIDELEAFWQVFPSLRETLFTQQADTPYFDLAITDKDSQDSQSQSLEKQIHTNADVQQFLANYNSSFANFADYLQTTLVDNAMQLAISLTKEHISNDIFQRLTNTALVDKYDVYQAFDERWQPLMIDLEILQTEGMASATIVDPHMVTKKVDNKETEVQDGWCGRVLPFELVQRELLEPELINLQSQQNRLTEISCELEELIDSLEEDYKEKLLNDNNDAFNTKAINAEIKNIYNDVSSPELETLLRYQILLDNKAKKPEKLAFIQENTNVVWSNIEANKDQTYGKKHLTTYIKKLQQTHAFAADSAEYSVVKAHNLIDEEKALKKRHKEASNALHMQTKTLIEGLNEAEVLTLLIAKWVTPIMADIHQQADNIIALLTEKLQALAEKYQHTYTDTASQLRTAEYQLADMLGQLEADSFDTQGIQALQSLLQAEGK